MWLNTMTTGFSPPPLLSLHSVYAKGEELVNSWEEKELFKLEDNGGAGTSFHF